MVRLLFAGIALVVAFSSAATAADTSWYVGASVGRTSIHEVCDKAGGTGLVQSCKDNTSSYKVYGGYNFTREYGLEWGYANLGKAEVISTGSAGTATSETWAVPITGVYNLPITERLGLVGRAGVYFFKSESKTTGNLVGPIPAVDDDGIEAVVGASVSLKVWQNLSLRLDWDHYNDAGPGDVDTLLGGVHWRF